MSAPSKTIAEVNSMSSDEFINTFGNVVEYCKLCAAAVAASRPFRDIKHLHSEISDFLDTLPPAGKEGILRLHPDLAGKLATSNSLSSESTEEQQVAGLDQLGDQERKLLQSLNNQYKQKYGFPFVICAKQNKKDAILKGIQKRLENDRNYEINTGINEVKKICEIRLRSIVISDAQSSL